MSSLPALGLSTRNQGPRAILCTLPYTGSLNFLPSLSTSL